MGIYTLLHASFMTKPDAPGEIIHALLKLAAGEKPKLEHGFFAEQCQSQNIFVLSSAYFKEPQYCEVYYAHAFGSPKALCVRVCSSLKNYHDEIEKFVDWVEPHIDYKSGPVIYSRYEENGHNKDELAKFRTCEQLEYQHLLEAKLNAALMIIKECERRLSEPRR